METLLEICGACCFGIICIGVVCIFVWAMRLCIADAKSCGGSFKLNPIPSVKEDYSYLTSYTMSGDANRFVSDELTTKLNARVAEIIAADNFKFCGIFIDSRVVERYGDVNNQTKNRERELVKEMAEEITDVQPVRVFSSDRGVFAISTDYEDSNVNRLLFGVNELEKRFYKDLSPIERFVVAVQHRGDVENERSARLMTVGLKNADGTLTFAGNFADFYKVYLTGENLDATNDLAMKEQEVAVKNFTNKIQEMIDAVEQHSQQLMEERKAKASVVEQEVLKNIESF